MPIEKLIYWPMQIAKDSDQFENLVFVIVGN